ncbi:MAG TPA: DUF2993 domain-containing protein [Jatrophihabitans sp.]|nr:DUF2993 domain-containing protein [Jatrophihabitans sp.]
MPHLRSDDGRAGRRLLIVLGILVVLLVAADRGGDWIAERAAADTIQSAQNLPQRPSVDITGFPFLTQLAAGKFSQIIITDHEVPVGGNSITVRVSSVRVVLDDVSVSRDFSSAHARTAKATATIDYADLGALLGAKVRYHKGGRITATKTITFAGQTLHGSITARPRISHGVLSFADAQIPNLGNLGQAVAGLLTKVFDVRLPVNGLPFNARVRSLYADADGLHLALTGADLTYSR